MTVKIRQEISFINRDIVVDSLGIASLNAADYNGASFYFEVVAKVASGTCVVGCYDTGDAANEVIVSVTATTYTIYRSAVFTPTAGDREYIVDVSGGTTPSIVSARIIILQSATNITNTQTQIEIGAYEADLWSASSYGTKPLTEPKHWKFESDKWNPTPTFTAAVTWALVNDKYDCNIKLQEDDGSFANWTNKVTIVTAGATETVTYTESASFTPTDGRHYRLVVETEATKAGRGVNIFNAKVIATQTGTITKLQPEYLMINDAQTDTGLQEFLTDWIPGEWEGVDNVYWHEHSSDSGSSNTKLVEDPGGTPADITNSDITGDNLVRSVEHYYGGGLSASYNLDDTYNRLGETFAAIGVNLKGARFNLCKNNSPTGNLTYQLFETSAGVPIGSALAISENLDVSTLTTNPESIYLSFASPYSMTPSTVYCIAVVYSDGDASNYVRVSATSNISGDYDLYRYDSSWAYEVNDLWFELNTDNILTMPATAKEIDTNIIVA